MIEVTLPQGGTTALPALPIELDGRRLEKRLDIPRVGEHGAAIARELGCEPALIAELIAEGVLGVDAPEPQASASGRTRPESGCVAAASNRTHERSSGCGGPGRRSPSANGSYHKLQVI